MLKLGEIFRIMRHSVNAKNTIVDRYALIFSTRQYYKYTIISIFNTLCIVLGVFAPLCPFFIARGKPLESLRLQISFITICPIGISLHASSFRNFHKTNLSYSEHQSNLVWNMNNCYKNTDRILLSMNDCYKIIYLCIKGKSH